ncbi:hypothetical protein GYMLUDRAFT_51540 [Collybiopsis luxurians FD-317 M1]|uniref:Secreted protein n=1 Tax=Collybiopsis luxurians FD-317 M1 TaxID=944289 RepID=A0A0D0B6P5_9AGAR|nr:hypothetical protein GYMLUDRAFT_51540 [Collybiopsis luxurians FD-317 M1]
MTRAARAVVWLMYLVDIFGRCKLIFGGSTGGALRLNHNGGYIVLEKPAQHPSTMSSIAGKYAITFVYP